MARLLLLEDEINLGATLQDTLGDEGYNVSWAKTIKDALHHVETSSFDLALIDVGLPDGSGFEFAARYQQLWPAAAMIFLTAFSSPEERIRGLKLGAEDYIVKPFQMQELLLRIRNGLKRSQFNARTDDPVQLGQLRLDFAGRTARSNGEDVHMTDKEWQLLRYLWDQRNRAVSRDEILDQIWTSKTLDDEPPSTRTIDNFIMRLRRQVEADPKEPNIILSVRGMGYKIQC